MGSSQGETVAPASSIIMTCTENVTLYEELLKKTEEYVKVYMAQYNDTSHDWSHIQRVRKMALSIAQLEERPVNMQLVELAALLHDVGDAKFLSSGTDCETILRTFMTEAGYPTHLQEGILWIHQRVSFRYELEHPDSHIGLYQWELACVQDADRLDAIGAIGIARCFSFNAVRNMPLCDPNIPPNVNGNAEQYKKSSAKSNARNHFYEKLFKIKGMMKTEAGKSEASRRHCLMREFILEFDRECGLDSSLLPS
ncbi:hypothetical protein PSACC_01261 [Paramicrosporidium saccamoebae]|uniref:HD/PDEase domain-containing protein n=1 Tax=Paramicrosporidium saccamoebae TaxID=1246581 RepID=A0A2H9TMA9_9FUNG|nr:hypothetical protein PSACC_01261 [Paramicrosporidium saccamoebae]